MRTSPTWARGQRTAVAQVCSAHALGPRVGALEVERVRPECHKVSSYG
jgi:hypothetical protein